MRHITYILSAAVMAVGLAGSAGQASAASVTTAAMQPSVPGVSDQAVVEEARWRGRGWHRGRGGHRFHLGIGPRWGWRRNHWRRHSW